MKKDKRATISDIARIANVSVATVSRALNNPEYPVSEETRKKILGIAKEIDYKPNIFSKMLKGGASKEIGVIVPNITNPFYSHLVSAVEKECIKNGYVPIICSSYNSQSLEEKHINMFSQKHVAGMLMSTISGNVEVLDNLSDNKMKFVLFDQDYTDLDYDSVSFDFYKGSSLALEYLTKHGHQDIAFLSAPIDRKSRKKRYEGYQDTLLDKGLKFDEQRVIISAKTVASDGGEFEFENGRALARLLLEGNTLPDAIVAINDMTAIGIIRELLENGFSVPDDISIIGFDNISISAMMTPALTTINQPSYETGTLATKMLLDRINGKVIKENKIILQPTLIERGSVKEIH